MAVSPMWLKLNGSRLRYRRQLQELRAGSDDQLAQAQDALDEAERRVEPAQAIAARSRELSARNSIASVIVDSLRVQPPHKPAAGPEGNHQRA